MLEEDTSEEDNLELDEYVNGRSSTSQVAIKWIHYAIIMSLCNFFTKF